MDCIKCGKTLTDYEIGLYKKLICRGAEEFACIECLSKHLGVPVDALREKITQFHNAGCVLF